MTGRWNKVAVLGAAGKMGSGIASLLLMEMAWRGEGVLALIDVNEEAFSGLKKYLRDQVKRHAERGINRLRERYRERKDLVDNGEMIEEFVEETLNRIECSVSLEDCKGAGAVFEAIVEDVELKGKVLGEVDQIVGGNAWYYTNTSSIPIAVLSKAAGIEGRIVGFHFYNPPAVQKLLEIIYPQNVNEELKVSSKAFAEKLGKVIVYSHDVAGFIGNGHFIREIAVACNRIEKLTGKMKQTEALCTVNHIGQDFLLRPMGIFQLIDYVGIEVCVHIGKVMEKYLKGERFVPQFLEKLLDNGIKGGQHSDGSQKDGVFKYVKGKPVSVYDLEKKGYVDFRTAEWARELPAGHLSWKELGQRKDRHELLDSYFSALWKQTSEGAKIAREMLEESRRIGHRLVDDGVADRIKDVDTVLENGFYHLYGVDAPFKAAGA